jgi:hypothetical protein
MVQERVGVFIPPLSRIDTQPPLASNLLVSSYDAKNAVLKFGP